MSATGRRTCPVPLTLTFSRTTRFGSTVVDQVTVEKIRIQKARRQLKHREPPERVERAYERPIELAKDGIVDDLNVPRESGANDGETVPRRASCGGKPHLPDLYEFLDSATAETRTY
jgi:hypothetical protein